MTTAATEPVAEVACSTARRGSKPRTRRRLGVSVHDTSHPNPQSRHGYRLDVNGDGSLDALVSAFERDRLIGMTRSDDPSGWTPIAEVALPGTLTTNVAVSDFGDSAVAAGAGNTLRIWR